MLNVVYSSDENYAKFMAVSINSLYINNVEINELKVFVLDNNISLDSKIKLNNIAKRYNREIVYIAFSDIESKAKTKLTNDRSLSMYSRLFIASLLPVDIEKVVYLDCDSLVLSSFSELLSIDLTSDLICGVKDIVSDHYKNSIWGNKDYSYINSGFLLINLSMWRRLSIESKIIEYINLHNGDVPHHDQGIINGLLYNQIRILPLRYNLITPYFEYDGSIRSGQVKSREFMIE